MQKRQQTETIQRLAFAGALEQAYSLVEIFPGLLTELHRLVKERAPKRRMSPEQRAELAAAVNGDKQTRKWSPARRKKFMATVRRKKREAGR